MNNFTKVITLSTMLLWSAAATVNAATNFQEEADTATSGPGFTAKSVGLLIGTAGIGVQGVATLGGNWGLRAGVQVLPSIKLTQQDKIGKTDVEHTYKINAGNLHVLADYYLPVLRSTGFRLSAGLGLFFAAKADVSSVPVGSYYFGEIQINDERMGTVESKVTRGGLAPYLGTGFSQLIHSGKFGLSLDVGSYYLLSKPNVKMSATGYLTGNERNEAQLEKNLEGYRWAPVVQIGLHYNF